MQSMKNLKKLKKVKYPNNTFSHANIELRLTLFTHFSNNNGKDNDINVEEKIFIAKILCEFFQRQIQNSFTLLVHYFLSIRLKAYLVLIHLSNRQVSQYILLVRCNLINGTYAATHSLLPFS